MARISIITPVFNGINYISQCVENVRAQGVSDMEHIVMDGGSTDGTVERLSELAQIYPHLSFVSEKDGGQSAAMNKGIRIAGGDIIGFLNVDDFYEPGTIAEGVRFLERHPEIDFVTGDCRVIDQMGNLISLNRPTDLRLEAMLLGWEYAQFPANPSAYFYRKRVHQVVGDYDTTEDYSMDLMFIYECAAKVQMAYLPRVWGNFRLMPGTKTQNDMEAGTGARRRVKIRQPWLDSLSMWRKLRMHRIKLRIQAGQSATWFFRAVRKRIVRLLAGPLKPIRSP